MKLVSKERIGGKIKRKYDTPKTPYHRVMESTIVSKKKKRELVKIYESTNPASLRRSIKTKLDTLYKVHQQKTKSLQSEVESTQKLPEPMVSYFIAEPVSKNYVSVS
jgi:hypothetical protein